MFDSQNYTVSLLPLNTTHLHCQSCHQTCGKALNVFRLSLCAVKHLLCTSKANKHCFGEIKEQTLELWLEV